MITKTKPTKRYFTFKNNKLPASCFDIEDEKELAVVSYMSSKILKSKNNTPKGEKVDKIVPMSANVKVFLCGSDRKVIANLEERGVIETVYVNGVRFSKEAGICCHYKFSEKIYNELMSGKFIKRSFSFPTIKPTTKKRKGKLEKEVEKVVNEFSQEKNNNKLLIQKTLNNLDDLSFDPSFEFNKNDLEEILTIKEISEKSSFAKRSTEGSGRIYHTVICGDRDLRQHLRHSTGERLVVVDARAFHPFIISTWMKDPTEKIRWIELISNCFYTGLLDVPPSEKDSLKEPFQIAISDVKIKFDSRAKEVREAIQEQFPILWSQIEEIHGGENSIQLVLQRIESSIFIDRVYDGEEKWCLPMHDGVLILESDLEYFLAKVDRAVLDVLRVNAEVTYKNLH